jgi:phage-related baseplate assembly protein
MPRKFGKVSRVNVVNDPSGINKRLAMYVISKDNDGYFVNTNGTVKSNLKVWLNKNRMMTDQVDVFDAAIINIGFNYKYTTESGFSKTSVQADVNAAVRKLFAEKQYLGEPVYITTIYQTVNRVQGVVDTLKVTPLIKQSANYSNLGLEIDDVLSKDGTFLKCPKNCVFEIKYPDQDLKGTIL